MLLTLLDFCWLLTVFQSADLPDFFLEQGTFLVGQPSPQGSGKQMTSASVVQGSVGVGTSSTQGQALKVITGQKTALFTQVMCNWCVSLILVLSDKYRNHSHTLLKAFPFIIVWFDVQFCTIVLAVPRRGKHTKTYFHQTTDFQLSVLTGGQLAICVSLGLLLCKWALGFLSEMELEKWIEVSCKNVL